MYPVTESESPVFKTISGRNYMEFAFNNEGELIGYQVEMIAHNPIEGLLESEVIRIDGSIHLAFDITSLVSLGKLFERKEFIRTDFISLIKQTVSLLERLNGYLLDSGGIVFDSRYIFINPQTLAMQFAYLPKKEMSDNLEDLKDMLLKIIIQEIRFSNETSDNFIQRLIEQLKEDEFKLETLKAYCLAMDEKERPVLRPSVQTVPYVQEDLKPGVPSKNEIKPDSIKSETGKKKKITLQYPLKSYVILCSVVFSFILFGVVLFLTHTLSADNPDFLLTLFGYLMIGGALSYLVYSKLFSKDKRVEKKENSRPEQKKPQKSSLYMPTQRVAPMIPPALKASGLPKERSEKSVEYVNKVFTPPQVKSAGTEMSPSQDLSKSTLIMTYSKPGTRLVDDDHTTLLDSTHLSHPSLKRIYGNENDSVLLQRFPFMIGRLAGQVDYCLNNPAIGKMHAEIKKTDAGYFITDMNSRNGTLINGERLEPSKEYRLEDGARLTVANEDFVFSEGRLDV